MSELRASEEHLSERHRVLEERFQTLTRLDKVTDLQKQQATEWLEQLEATRSFATAPLRVAFIAEVGCGKSSLVAAASGLHLEIQGDPKDWSMLPVGDGRTTLGETHIFLEDREDREDIQLTIEPLSAKQLRTEIELFVETEWVAARAAAARETTTARLRPRDAQAPGEELYSLLREWLAPGLDPTEKRTLLRAEASEHAGLEDPNSSDEADVVGDSKHLQALTQRWMKRIDPEQRSRPYQAKFAANEEGLERLLEVIGDAMNGKLPGGPAPRVTRIDKPRGGAPVGLRCLVDTQGVDSDATSRLVQARPDIQRCLADENTLLLVCSGYEAAPDAATRAVLAEIGRLQTVSTSAARPLRVLIVDKRSQGKRQSTEDFEDHREEKLYQCRAQLREAATELGVSVEDEHVIALDVRREPAKLQALLADLVDEARQARLVTWDTALAEAQTAIEPLEAAEEAHQRRLRELDLRICWIWDEEVKTRSRQPAPALNLLAAAIAMRDPWIRHWSHIRAAVRRRGRYENLDLVEVAAGLEVFASTFHYKRAVKAIHAQRKTGWLTPINEAEAAHIQLRIGQLDRRIELHREQLLSAWTDTISAHFESSACDELWRRCRKRWGLGPGYVSDIAEYFNWESNRAQLALAANRVPTPPEDALPARSKLLKLDMVELQNFRPIEKERITLNPITVLIGDNGLGKTTWLEAIAAALGTTLPFLSTFQAPPLSSDDIRYTTVETDNRPDLQHQLPMRIKLEGTFQSYSCEWTRELRSADGEEARGEDTPLGQLLLTVDEEVRAHKARPLPVLAYYGTDRLWPVELEANLDPSSKERSRPGSRQDGYADCLNSASTHRHMLDWVAWFTLAELQRKESIGGLRAISAAVVDCVEDATSFGYDIASNELRLTMTDGRVVPFRLLSDGYRNVVAMVADIAWRASVLNPQLGAAAPRLAEGVVLIDEVDLHLHPKWQRRVLRDLRRAFPRMQFICTTHSPFIVQSLEPGQLVNLDADAQDVPYANRSPEDIAEALMGVDVPQRSQRHQEMLRVATEYYKLLDQVPEASEEELRHVRVRLDELEAPFSQDMAFTASLRLERLAAEGLKAIATEGEAQR